MTLTLNNVSKKFGRDWILKEVNYEFHSGSTYAILGPNGSGKSTLMQILSGNISVTSGKVAYQNNGVSVPVDNIFHEIGFCAPYMQLIEEFTLQELLHFHFKFKKALKNISVTDVPDLLDLAQETDKPLKFFSSGMKQRAKLALAVLSDVQIILLDEPATNLDEKGIKWFKSLLNNYLQNRLLIISSNREEEYEMCENRLNVMDFK